MHINWDPILSVHVKLIDEQHKHFIGIINQLDDAIAEGIAAPKLFQIFDALQEYWKIHIATEETYFDRFKYEGATEHKAAHAWLVGHMTDLRQRAGEDPASMSVELIEFLQDWLTRHIARHDKAYEKCFHEHGLT